MRDIDKAPETLPARPSSTKLARLRTRFGISMAALAASVLTLLFAVPAQAAPTHIRHEALDVTGLNHACGAAVDSKGDLYLASAGESKVKVYDPSHNLLTSIVDSNTPCGLAVTSTGNLYVSEKATGEVVRFKPNAYPFAGTPTYGSREVLDASTKAKGIAVDPFDNRLYVAEGNRVSAYDAKGNLGINEVQSVTVVEATGGTFKLKFGGQETGAITYEKSAVVPSAEELQKALEGLSSIGAGNVSVGTPSEGSLNRTYPITFTGALARTDVEMIESDSAGLTGGVSKKIIVEEEVKGWSGRIGEGVLSEASGVAAYTAETPETSAPIGRYLAVADADGVAADRLDLFGGKDIRALKLHRELTGTTTPDGSFGFGAAGAYLAADPGTVKANKCTTVGEEACTAGHLFLYDAAHKALDEFDGSGEYLDRAAPPAFADAEPTAIAIDRSGGANDGTIYVTAGAGTGAEALAFRPLVQPGRAILAEPISRTLTGARAVATDANGYVYVGAGTKVSVFDPKGKEVTSFTDAGGPTDLAVDSKCNVYVLDGEAEVTYYAPSPSGCLPTSGTTYTRHTPVVVKGSEFPSGAKSLKGIAVNPGPSAGKDHLFVTSFKVTREYDSAANGSTLLNAEFDKTLLPSGGRQSIAVNGANGNVYFGAKAGTTGGVFVVNPTGEEPLALIGTAVSTTGVTGSNPFVAVDQSNGHAIEFDGAKKSAREYDAVTGAFVAEFGNFTEGLTVLYRVAADNACAIHEPQLTGAACEAFDPANGNVYVAFADTSGSHPPYNGVNAFGPLTYPVPPEPTKFELKVKESGTGSGTVTSQPEGIECQPICSHKFEQGVTVRLSESPKVESEFIGWSGCDSIDEGECLVTMSAPKEVEAEFKSTVTATEELKVIVEPPSSGIVMSSPSGIECPATCAAKFAKDAGVTLAEKANEGFKFEKWSGCDSEPAGTCFVEMNTPRVVKAIFSVATYPLTVKREGNGKGTVTSSPAGIDCGLQCSHEFPFQTKVKLSQKAEEGSEFKEWTGACTGTGLCEVTINKAMEVGATFKALPHATVFPPHPIAYTEAMLRGEVQTAEVKTEYWFEYLTQAQFEEEGESFEGAQQTPESELAPAKAPVSVQANLEGLEEGTAYRFRLVTTSTAGRAEDEGSFTTLQRRSSESCPNAQYRFGLSANLPDCRAYELVTPAQTDGLIPYAADASGTPSGGFSNWLTVQRGEGGGERLSYFTDGTLPGFEGNGRRDGYRAERGPGDHPAGGWQSAVVSPGYVQAGGAPPHPLGTAADQLYSIWEVQPEVLSGSLPEGVYLRSPAGFEALGRGSLGTDLEALSRYVSAGGTYAIFASKEHLEEKAAPKGIEALYDRAAGEATAEVISVKPDGSSFGEGASYLGTAEDGAAVAFRVGGTLYLHREGKTTEVATAPNTFAGISEDGSRVFYAAAGEGASPSPLYACDTATGPCAGSGAHSPLKIANAGIFAMVSPDGSHAFFSSEEVLTGGEENENCEETKPGEVTCEKAQAGAHNLYAWDGAETHFVARLTAADFEHKAFAGIADMNLAAWTEAIAPTTGGQAGGRALSPTRSTPEGGAFVFQSHARLTAYDNEGVGEIYRYDPAAEAGEGLACVSCDPSGTSPSSDALLEDIRQSVSGIPVRPRTMIANLTDNGEEVFFQSFDRLLPEDANDVEDVYEWRAKGIEGPGGDVCRRSGGCLALISSGQSEVPSFLYAMSADGQDVFFATREKLVGSDEADSPSIYDAREEGGIPEPSVPAPCQGDACQGSGSVPPVVPVPTTTGPGEESEAPKPCAKGKHRVKGRCVAPKKHKHRRHHRRAHANRGGGR